MPPVAQWSEQSTILLRMTPSGVPVRTLTSGVCRFVKPSVIADRPSNSAFASMRLLLSATCFANDSSSKSPPTDLRLGGVYPSGTIFESLMTRAKRGDSANRSERPSTWIISAMATESAVECATPMLATTVRTCEPCA